MLLLHGNNHYHAKEHEYQGTEIEAENTYRAELGLHLYGKSRQETTTGVNLVDALNSEKWKETGWGGTEVKYLKIEDGVITLTAKDGWRNYTQILDDTLINTTLFYCFEARIASGYENFAELLVHGDGQNTFPKNTISIKLLKTEWTMFTDSILTNATIAGFGLVPRVVTEDEGQTISIEIRNLIVATSEISAYEPYTGGIPSPNPDYPQPINSIGDSGSVDVVVSDNNGNSQTLTINTPNRLCGIPVDTGGNYTDSTGQQWICDEVDFERGVFVQRIGKIVSYNGEQLSTKYMSTTGKLTTGASVIYVLATPIETPLTAEELTAYKAIKSYPHYTHIESAAELRIKLKEY